MQASREDAVAALSVFKLENFRPQQEEVILSAMAGHHVFVRLPTGGGKSLCFQLLAVASPGSTIVISPLVSLMEDQVVKLRSLGVPCMLYNSLMSEEERELAPSRLPAFKLLYTTPEQLTYPTWRLVRTLVRMYEVHEIQRIMLDEAHSVLRWGDTFRNEAAQQSFDMLSATGNIAQHRTLQLFFTSMCFRACLMCRPSYRAAVVGVREMFPDIPIMALTATATHTDIVALQDLLNIDPVTVRSFTADTFRRNLCLSVKGKQGLHHLVQHVTALARNGRSGIVYWYHTPRKYDSADGPNLPKVVITKGIMVAPFNTCFSRLARSHSLSNLDLS